MFNGTPDRNTPCRPDYSGLIPQKLKSFLQGISALKPVLVTVVLACALLASFPSRMASSYTNPTTAKTPITAEQNHVSFGKWGGAGISLTDIFFERH